MISVNERVHGGNFTALGVNMLIPPYAYLHCHPPGVLVVDCDVFCG